MFLAKEYGFKVYATDLWSEQEENQKFFAEMGLDEEEIISFIAYVTFDKAQFIKLYPEGNAEVRFNLRGKGDLYIYCNIDGLMKIKT